MKENGESLLLGIGEFGLTFDGKPNVNDYILSIISSRQWELIEAVSKHERMHVCRTKRTCFMSLWIRLIPKSFFKFSFDFDWIRFTRSSKAKIWWISSRKDREGRGIKNNRTENPSLLWSTFRYHLVDKRINHFSPLPIRTRLLSLSPLSELTYLSVVEMFSPQN